MKSTALNMDCMEYMKAIPDKYFDLVIADPPYGHNALDGSRTKTKYGIDRANNWDCYRPNKLFFKELFRISSNQIIWGGNYFISDLYDSKCMIVWDKKIAEGMNNYSMCEIAWTSYQGRPSKIYSRIASQENRIHPTQKPVKLYEWILKNYAKAGDKIFDPMFGSGSSRIACHKHGFEWTGCELDKHYFDLQEKRFKEYIDKQTLF